MLDDRDYMREKPRRGGWSVTAVVSVVLVLVFALQCINRVYLHTPLESWLALTPDCLQRGWVWELITFQFLHANLWHIACNLIVFWWVGHFVERVLGAKRFLIALLGCGAVGGLLQVLLMVAFPGRYGGAVVGASAGVAGLFAIFALLAQDSEVLLYFIFPVRAITLLWIFGIVSLFFTLVPTGGQMGIANAAHLGGILAGIFWVKLGWHQSHVQLPWEGWLEGWRQRRSALGRRPGNTLVTAPHRKAFWRSAATTKADEEVSTDEFFKTEVDPILEKISAHGIHSLTAREREVLERARSKMGKR
ncbi:MAG: rhomboid family intramembrane serine protease [Verrucomicrobiota bacterium]|jgi:membrane associated rhomboid family serine protease